MPLPVSKFSKFLVEWKASIVCSSAESLLSVQTGLSESRWLILASLASSVVVEIQFVNLLCEDHSEIFKNLPSRSKQEKLLRQQIIKFMSF